MTVVGKPRKGELELIRKILLQWTEKEEADKYLERIDNEIGGTTEFNMFFWVARGNGNVLGVVGLADPLPKVLPLAETKNSAETKILYIDKKHKGKGIGRKLVDFLENEARRQEYSELMVRSADRYQETAWGFYKRLGYIKIGTFSGGGESKTMQVFSKELLSGLA